MFWAACPLQIALSRCGLLETPPPSVLDSWTPLERLRLLDIFSSARRWHSLECFLPARGECCLQRDAAHAPTVSINAAKAPRLEAIKIGSSACKTTTKRGGAQISMAYAADASSAGYARRSACEGSGAWALSALTRDITSSGRGLPAPCHT